MEAFSGWFTFIGLLACLFGGFFTLRGKSIGPELIILGGLSLLVGWLA
ncbi:MAG: hypothetical protein M0Z65_03235 [Firmicutes bacterium]|uniref:Uncharacterized protein n=1 Tax=Melghirimyces thermohalophilus TaxID=1236220 RepID=A0A1G6I2B7_9BACL|nr:hypothetical protein [Melghirimyces thermohalophilus]MDA8352193.1 hypothetical protein [Bacillota bacterium]SDC00689.1 hypothetical protein SAMN04488112_10217 [Melghirimyces thermohalophilus]